MNGVVVAPQPAAVETGAEILEQGGNAFDAAVAAGYMQMVVDPFMCGLGGWGAATLYDAGTSTFSHVGFWPRIGSRMYPRYGPMMSLVTPTCGVSPSSQTIAT